MKYLQPPALIAELGPAPEPGLAGALNFLAGHRQCVLEPALVTQQRDQFTGGGRGNLLIALSHGLVVGAAQQRFGLVRIHLPQRGTEYDEVLSSAGGLGDAPQQRYGGKRSGWRVAVPDQHAFEQAAGQVPFALTQ
jgi:hypothetical protein